jgi:RTX calcium-binding nonapeptide repeat (4 copies)
MTLSPTRFTAGELPYRPTEPICIIFKKISTINIIMQQKQSFTIKIIKNIENITIQITITTPIIRLTSPFTALVSAWGGNFFGTSGPDTLVGTDNNDKILGLKGSDVQRGEGASSDALTITMITTTTTSSNNETITAPEERE